VIGNESFGEVTLHLEHSFKSVLEEEPKYQLE